MLLFPCHADELGAAKNSFQDRADAAAVSTIAATVVTFVALVTVLITPTEAFAKTVAVGVNVAILVAITCGRIAVHAVITIAGSMAIAAVIASRLEAFLKATL